MTDNRQSFEKWVLSRETRFALRRDRWMPEDYEDADTQLAWVAWQAARQGAGLHIPPGWKLVPEEPTPHRSTKMSEWQPIETAPKDGTVIIVPGGLAYWRERLNHWETSGWYSITAIDYPGRLILWEIAHWMPLPEPPNTSVTGGSAAQEKP